MEAVTAHIEDVTAHTAFVVDHMDVITVHVEALTAHTAHVTDHIEAATDHTATVTAHTAPGTITPLFEPTGNTHKNGKAIF